jgi:hypothetical protein
MRSCVFGQEATVVGPQCHFIPRSLECLHLKTKQIRISETSVSTGRKIQRRIPVKNWVISNNVVRNSTLAQFFTASPINNFGTQLITSRDCRLPARFKWNLSSCWMLRREDLIVTDVSRRPVAYCLHKSRSPKKKYCLTLDDSTDRLSLIFR